MTLREADEVPDVVSPEAPGGGDTSGMDSEHQVAWTLILTAAIVAFVGAVVVLSIPYAVLSVSLPPDVDRLGLKVGTLQALLFGHPWYLLLPSALFALWVAFRVYRSCREQGQSIG